MSRLPLLIGLLALPVLAGAQTLPCQNPAADPCVIAASVTIPPGTYDIRPKSLVIQNKQITLGVGVFAVSANNVTFQPGARIIATDTNGATSVVIDATGTMDIQSQGTTKSRINVTGGDSGGVILLSAGGNLSLNGNLSANATNLLGFGGNITLHSNTGNVTVTGDPSEGIKSTGGSQGGGGTIALEAPLGSISLSTQLVPKGGDCGGCEVDLTAGTTITSTAQGVINMTGSGIGDGGFFSAIASGDINLQGDIIANGSGTDMEGGSGGDIFISTDGAITLGGRIEVNGAPPDGDGGTADISAGTTIVQSATAPILATAPGFGQADEISFDAPGNITLGGNIDVSADDFGGDVTVTSDGLVTISARIKSATPIDPVNKPEAFGGTLDIAGCQINIPASGQLICTGPGGDPVGTIFLTASTGLTIAGDLTATSTIELDWRSSQPTILAGAVVTPAPTIIQDPQLPCCGVQCTTTTTTSTTSSTSTTHLTTTTTSTTHPTTTTTSTTKPTTTTGVVSTTTTTTVPVPPTTSTTTVGVSTTTSTTKAPTTTTSTTVAPTTTSTSSTTTTGPTTTSSTTTTGPTTTSTSTTTTTGASTSTLATTTSTTASPTSTAPVPSTTSTTAPPLTCFDTATGVDAVRCRVDEMSHEIGTATTEELGGAKLARRFATRIEKVRKLIAEPTKTGKLRKAGKQLKTFSRQFGAAVAKGKIDPDLAASLQGLAGEASSRLAGVIAGG